MQSTPDIPKRGAIPMQVDTELEMPLDIPISTRTTTTTDSAKGKASLDVTQLDDAHATPSEPDQQENHQIGTDPYIGKRVFMDRQWHLTIPNRIR